jgi:DNA-binding CsgD family transcriptional regulator
MGLVERSKELSMLQGLLADCASGNGQMALVCGPVGSGKTELLYAFGERAVDAGTVFLSAVGSDAERIVPFGLLDQLFRGALLPADVMRQMDWLLQNTAVGAAEDAASVAMRTRTLHGWWRALAELSGERPVVIGVDDVEYADPQSMQGLLYLVRKLRRARMFLVCSVSAHAQRTQALFQTELLRYQHCRRIRLRPLSRRAVTEVICAALGADDAKAVAAEYHRITRGNPLLIRSLLEDLRDVGGAADGSGVGSAATGQPVVGTAFGHAIVACLHRGGERTLALARGLALLDQSATVPLLAKLVGVDEFELTQVLADLEAAGLLEGVRFCHPAARQAVIADLPAEQRLDLHRRAAQLLYLDGAPTVSIARQLLAADDAGYQWAVPVLQEAAEQAMATDDLPYAGACLSLSLRGCTDETERAAVTAALAQVEWRLNPWTAARHLTPLTDAVREGRVHGRHLPSLVRSLLWHGRTQEAIEAVAQVGSRSTDADAADLGIAFQWLASWHPPLVNELGDLPAVERPAAEAITANERFVAASLLARAITGDADEGIVRGAEAVMRGVKLDDSTLDQVESALLTLVYADQSDRALDWCEPLLQEAIDRGAPTWEARLAALRAEIALRHGDLPEAERNSRVALSRIPLRGWGVAVGGPLSTLVLTSTMMGRHERAAEALRQPVPEAMHQTRFQLQYGYARGQHHLRADRLHAALSDFLNCGAQAQEWGLDVPALIPWRSGAAVAYLRLGDRTKARQMVEQQLELTRRGSRSQGMTLRLLAATQMLRRRAVVLREAVDVLQGTGDRLELAAALVDLYRTHRAMGDRRRADAIEEHALQLAKECQAEPLEQSLLRKPFTKDEEQALRDEAILAGGLSPAALKELSKAERRVIALAAIGHTNREIAGKLYITISTVEQHLTHAYRKLNVTSRADMVATVSQSA